MSETKWTQGEWRYIKTSRYGHDRMVDTWIVKSESDVGVAVQPMFSDDAVAEANARLIAAAPELYEWLQRCLDMVDKGDGAPNWDGIRAVLAKARGE